LAKKKREKKPREVTKHQLSRWQQQQRREHIIRYIGIFIVVAIIIFLGTALFITEYRPMYETVIKVNDTKFNMKYYVDMLELQARGQEDYALYYMTSQVETIIKQNELIRLGALALGFTVSDEKIDEVLEERGLPSERHYRDTVRTELLVNKLLDEHFEHAVPEFSEQIHVQAMFLESESQAREFTEKLEAGEDFTKLAAEFSLDNITKEKKGDLGWHPTDILSELLDSPVATDYVFSAETGVLSPPLYDEEKLKGISYWLVKLVERKEAENEAHIMVMQLGSEVKAREAKARLDAGEDFGDVAVELSLLDDVEENRGDMGWTSPGSLGSTLEDFIFDSGAEPGTLSEIIRDEESTTAGGYWLVKVLGKDENREISDEDRTALKGKALNEWVESLWDNPDNKIESFLDEKKIAWAVDKVMGS